MQTTSFHLTNSCFKRQNQAGEMFQQLGAMAALTEDLESIPNTHMAANNCP